MHPRLSRFAAIFTLLAACGPNFRYVYDSEVSFERCYSEDFNPSSDAQTRTHCWQTFVQSYAFGTNTEHISYARNRIAHPESPPSNGSSASSGSPASGSGGTSPPGEALSARPNQAPSSGSQGPVRASLPTEAPAPTQARAPESVSAIAPIEPPGSACASECRARWSTCSTACQATQTACVAGCDDTFRECVRGCY